MHGSALRRGPRASIVFGVAGATFSIRYRFDFPGGSSKEFLVELEKPAMRFVGSPASPRPQWTLLSHHQCPNCPYSAESQHYCPVAVNLVRAIELFAGATSHEEANVTVVTESRAYSARANMTHAVGSLIGIIMATSGCPIMDRLKPMVLTHLPFATTDESTYRSVSMYLMAQYFRYKTGRSADWNLEKLSDFFEDINLVNQSFVKRLTSYVENDASLNAVVLLNCFVTAAKRVIARERFEELEQLFEAFLGDEA